MASRISIVVPAYNEEKLIAGTVRKLRKIGEVIVVSDGTDNTAEKARDAGAYVVEFSKRLGKGGAIKQGLTIADGDVVGYVDADMPVGIQDLRRLISVIPEYDMAIASRWKGLAENYPLFRRMASRIGNLSSRVLLGLPFSDTQCGAKFFVRDLVGLALSVRTDGFSFDMAFLKKSMDEGFSIVEIPVRWRHGERKPRPSLKDGLKLWLDIWRFAIASP